MSEVTAIAVEQASWTAHSSILSSIRRRVFIEEQGVPEPEEWDGLDETARHLWALSPSGEAIGTARLLVETSNDHSQAASYHIGRVAVLPFWRGRGVGTALMQAAIHWCQQEARPRPAYIHLNAQCDRLSFYERLGFEARGDVFMDAGIAHQAMFLRPQSTRLEN